MTRDEFNKIESLHKAIKFTYKECCRMLGLNFKKFNQHKYQGYRFDDETNKNYFNNWTEELDNELIQHISNSHVNLQASFEEFSNNHEIDHKCVQNRWYGTIKRKLNISVFENIGNIKTSINTKNVWRGYAINKKFIKETTDEMKELHNIPIFDSTIIWSFKYIYKF